MLPVLKEASKGEQRIANVVETIASELKLSPDERAELLPSGKQTIIGNRVHWAKSYLKQAGLVTSTKRGHFVITARGQDALNRNIPEINVKFLRQFPDFVEFQNRSREDTASNLSGTLDEANTTATPEEVLRSSHSQINKTVSAELIDRLRQGTPAFFERAMVSLLLEMGYGGNGEDAGRAIGQSGDDGVDGVIDQDALGVDQIYIQAKRYASDNTVGPAAIRDFFGALSLKKAQKGIFITTSSFTKSAIDTANQIGGRIVLIDAKRLGELLLKYNVGCRSQEVLHIKKVDEDFFE
ncbi:restriction endonuclease [Altererythrobacter sp. RZ02]|uniref:Restriction endonuclease n=2 Tax=Pontixanthobacter rizhaonensis TaxID=2730337 RepID=A0A848QNG7_9SPHN|nr:restriction endonuclease [Pontixanthobacter rizhaonensis]